jgi:hypothetical protein
MKVSWKVGRRSHSSISRRRLRSKKSNKNKSSYKKRYGKTHKGGKRGRFYKCARTHKRGKRFHRGGEGEFKCPTTWTLDTDSELSKSKLSKSIKLGVSQAVVQGVTLSFIKKASLTFKPVSGQFTITLRVYNSPVSQAAIQGNPPPVFEVLLKRSSNSRDDNKSVSFSITNLGDFTDKEALKQLVRLEKPGEIYDFSFNMNDDTFKKIQKCVREKLKEVYTKLQRLLELCTNRLTNDNGTIKCTITGQVNTENTENTQVQDVQDVQNFLDSMFTTDSEYIYANLTRLRLLAPNIVLLLGKEEILTPLDNKYFTNLNVALNEFGDVYRQITCDTHEKNGDCYVEEHRIYA